MRLSGKTPAEAERELHLSLRASFWLGKSQESNVAEAGAANRARPRYRRDCERTREAARVIKRWGDEREHRERAPFVGLKRGRMPLGASNLKSDA